MPQQEHLACILQSSLQNKQVSFIVTQRHARPEYVTNLVDLLSLSTFHIPWQNDVLLM